MVVKPCKSTRSHCAVHFKMANFMVCELSQRQRGREKERERDLEDNKI